MSAIADRMSLRRQEEGGAVADSALSRQSPTVTPEQADVEAFTSTAGPLRRGLRGGINSALGLVNNLAGQVGETLGLSDFAADRFKAAEEYTAFSDEVGAPVRDIAQVRDFGSLIDFVAGMAGQGIATSVPAIGLALGLRRPVAGVFAGAAPLEAGEQVAKLRADPTVMASSTPGEVLGNAAARGIIGGGLEVVGGASGQAARAILRPTAGASLKKAAAGVGKSIAGEAVTEGAQEAVGQGLHQSINPEKEYDLHEIINSMAAGAAGGGGIGLGVQGPAAVAGALRGVLGRPRMPADPDGIPVDVDKLNTEEDIVEALRRHETESMPGLDRAWEENKGKEDFQQFKDYRTDPEVRARFVQRVQRDFASSEIDPVIDQATADIKKLLPAPKDDGSKKSQMRTKTSDDILQKLMEVMPEENKSADPAKLRDFSMVLEDMVRNPRALAESEIPSTLRRALGSKYKEFIDYSIDRVYGTEDERAEARSILGAAAARRATLDDTRLAKVEDIIRTFIRPEYMVSQESRQVALEELAPQLLDYLDSHPADQKKGNKERFARAMVEAFGERWRNVMEELDVIRNAPSESLVDSEQPQPLSSDDTPYTATGRNPDISEETGVPIQGKDAALEEFDRLNAQLKDRSKKLAIRELGDDKYSIELEDSDRESLDNEAWERVREPKQYNRSGLDNGIFTVKTYHRQEGTGKLVPVEQKINLVRLTSEMMRNEAQQTKEGDAEYVADMFARGMSQLLSSKIDDQYRVRGHKIGVDKKGNWGLPDNTLIGVLKGKQYRISDIKNLGPSSDELRGFTKEDVQRHKNRISAEMAAKGNTVNPNSRWLNRVATEAAAAEAKAKGMAKTVAEPHEQQEERPQYDLDKLTPRQEQKLQGLLAELFKLRAEGGNPQRINGIIDEIAVLYDVDATTIHELNENERSRMADALPSENDERNFDESTGLPLQGEPARGPQQLRGTEGAPVKQAVRSTAVGKGKAEQERKYKEAVNEAEKSGVDMKQWEADRVAMLKEATEALSNKKGSIAPNTKSEAANPERQESQAEETTIRESGVVAEELGRVQGELSKARGANRRRLAIEASLLQTELNSARSIEQAREEGAEEELERSIKFKFSTMNVGKGPVDKETQDAVRDYVARVLGKDKVKVLFETMKDAGKFAELDGVETLKIAIDALDPMSVGRHEALHAFFARLTKANEKAAKVLLRAARSPAVQIRLRELLKDHPDALKQLSDPEESLAYMYQFWAGGERGLLRVGPETKGWFDKVKSFLNKIMAVWADVAGDAEAVEQAGEILHAFHNGKFANRSTVAEVLHKTIPATGFEAAKRIAPWLGRFMDKFIWTSTGAVRGYGIDAMNTIMDKFYAETGSAARPGYLQTKHIMANQWMNRLNEAIKGMNEAQIADLLTEMRSGRPRTSEAAVKVEGILHDAFQYMKSSGVKRVSVNKNGEYEFHELKEIMTGYFPRVPDKEYIQENMEEFMKLLAKYNIAEPEKVAQAMLREGKASEPDHELGMTMFAPQLNERTLASIPDSELAPFLHKNFYGILSQYFVRAAKRSEYAKRFGNAGEQIDEAYAKAKKEGATPDQLKTFKDSVEAMEGVLGGDISPELRGLYGALTTYQNIRLLPMALFAQVIDPIGIWVRGGEAKEAWGAFSRGMRELFSNKEDDAAELARTVGTINTVSEAAVLGDMYSSQFMSQGQKKINDLFFKYNGMESWNRSMRIAAASAAENFITRHAERPNKHSTRYLAELGLTKGDVSVVNDKLVLSPKVISAINQWVDSAIIRPNAAIRPIYMSDPNWILVSHLKQFSYAFQKVILSRVGHEMNNGNYNALFALGAYVPAMIMADMLRIFMSPGDGDDRMAESWTLMDWLWRGIQRAALFGPGQFVLDSHNQGIESIAGPTAAQITDFVRAGPSGFQRELIDAVPGVRLFK